MSLDGINIICYLVVVLITLSRDAFYASLAITFCCIFSLSDLYTIAVETPYHIHLIFLICYLLCISATSHVLTKVALGVMGVLNIVMALDVYVYPTTETWYFINYEANTTTIHALIILSLVMRRENISIYHRVSDRLRKLFNTSTYVYLVRHLSFHNK